MRRKWLFLNVTGYMLSLLMSPVSAEVQFEDSYVIRPPNEAVRSAIAVTTISNLNAYGVELVGVSSPDADKVEFHRLEHKSGLVSMTAQPAIYIAGNALVELHEGGLHIMMMGLSERFSELSSTEFIFSFSRGDPLRQAFPIVRAARQGSEQSHKHH